MKKLKVFLIPVLSIMLILLWGTFVMAEENDDPPMPVIPKMNACQVTAKGIMVSWNPVDNADSYNLHILDEKTGTWDVCYHGTATSFEYTPATSGKVYHFSAESVYGELTSGYDQTGKPGVWLSQPTPTVKRSGESAVVKWTKAVNADGYKVYRRLKDGKEKAIGDVEAPSRSYTDDTVKQDTEYIYTVKAYVNYNGKEYDGWYDPSVYATFTYFSAPELKKVANVEDGISFSWTRKKGAAKYNVYRKAAGESWKLMTETKSGSYLDTKARYGVVYRYTACAVDKNGILGSRDPKGLTGCYIPVTRVQSAKNDVAGVTLTWDNIGTATGYRIYRQTSEYDRKGLTDVFGATAYTDPTAVSGQKYQYYIRAFKEVDGIQYFAHFDETAGKSILRLAAPTLSKISGDNGLTISWNAVDGALKYRVLRRAQNSDPWKKIGVSVSTSFQDKKAVTGTVYHYTVAALNKKVASAYQEPGIAGAIMNAPPLNSLASTMNGLKLKWTKVAGASHYDVMRKNSNGKWTVIKTTKAASYLDKDVIYDHSYTYTVRPVYKEGTYTCYGKYNTTGIKAIYRDIVREAIKKCLNQSGRSLRDAFEWVVNLDNIGYTNKQPDAETTRAYAKWCLDRNQGSSFGKSAVFALMAKELGYEAYLVSGYMKDASGKTIKHGWVELYDNGILYVCELAYANDGSSSFFERQYGRPGVPKYQDYHRVPER